MIYPKYGKVNGKKYPINTSFKVALRCFDVVEDDSISDTERALAIIYLLFGFIPKDHLDDFLAIATQYLQRGETTEQQSAKARDIDFNSDMGYIMSSFMSDYGINLIEIDMHFYQFIDLIQGLTEKSSLTRVRDIRNYNLNEIKDSKFRAKMAEAQERLKLPEKISRDDQEALDEFNALFL